MRNSRTWKRNLAKRDSEKEKGRKGGREGRI
jgi:hypothetical protein